MKFVNKFLQISLLILGTISALGAVYKFVRTMFRHVHETNNAMQTSLNLELASEKNFRIGLALSRQQHGMKTYF